MTDYPLIVQQMQALAEISSDGIALMANVSALLYHAMEDINWAGFYLVKDGALLIGPFQGKPACVKIAKGKGVCGTAWAQDRVQVVDDVHAFPGHIACDSASNSEIVLPIHRDGAVIAVLDIDSPVPARFGEDDAAGLTALTAALERGDRVIPQGAAALFFPSYAIREETMKTIFDMLNLPRFRECPALFLGEQDLSKLEMWMLGYTDACADVGTEAPLLTPQGLSISLLRDYIACREHSLSTGSIAELLSGGEDESAWRKFFAYLDEFEALRILDERKLEITEEMARHAVNRRKVFIMTEAGELAPYPFLGCVYRKTVLSGGLCRIRAEAPDGTEGVLPGNTAILPEEEAEKNLTELYGAILWEPA